MLMCMLSLFERKQLFPGVVRLDGKNVMKKRKIKQWKCETCNHRAMDASRLLKSIICKGSILTN